MDRPILLSQGQNHTAIDLGNLENLMDYSYLHPKLKTEIRGKIFTGEILQTTGAEISFQVLPPSAEIPFMHSHRNHEEIYIFLKGVGEFQIDGKVFEIREGSGSKDITGREADLEEYFGRTHDFYLYSDTARNTEQPICRGRFCYI